MSLFEFRKSQIEQLLDKHQLDALLLQRVSSFAWATGGAASYVNTATTNGEASLLVTPKATVLITNNIEATRLAQEEALMTQGWDFRITSWYQTSDVIDQLISGLALGADVSYPGAKDLSQDIGRLRAILTPDEGNRFRELGRICAQAMEAAIRAVRPGQSEYEIAARLGYEAESRGAQPIVNLVATDQRIFDFRHPLPTAKKLDRYAMLILCGRSHGLVCSITRLVYFGALPNELRRKSEAVAKIDATFIAATCPGITLNHVFEQAKAAYAAVGYADEWQLHHQGGPAGYEARELIATPETSDTVISGQAYAWNPSITGTKSEDTILIGDENNEVLTEISDWPVITVTVGGETFLRPAILEL